MAEKDKQPLGLFITPIMWDILLDILGNENSIHKFIYSESWKLNSYQSLNYNIIYRGIRNIIFIDKTLVV